MKNIYKPCPCTESYLLSELPGEGKPVHELGPSGSSHACRFGAY